MTGLTAADVARITGGELTGDGSRPVTGAKIDSRAVTEGDMFLALPGEKADGHDYIAKAFSMGASCCLVRRVPEGENRPVIVVPDVEAAFCELARVYRAGLSLPVVGITGSVGKTTAKDMTVSVLSARYSVLGTEKNFNNNLGVPLTLCRIDPRHQAAVVEMGISHFGEMSALARMAMPDIAVYTNIGRAHLEFLGNRAGVMRAKGELLDVMRPDGLVIVNGDDEYLCALSCRQRKIRCGLTPGCDVRAENISRSGAEGISCDIVRGERRIPVVVNAFGDHMISAALLAAAVGMELGLTDEQIASGAAAFVPPEGRAHIMKTPYLTIVDDCYNANPDSMAAAIESAAALPGRLVCILGDMLELGDNSLELHRQTGRLALERGAQLLAVGELSEAMGGEHFETKRELLAALPGIVAAGDTVLVKASHSMGFSEIVEALKGMVL